MKQLKFFTCIFALVLFFSACKKDKGPSAINYTYYEVGFKSDNADWRDTAFIVRTSNQALIDLIEQQLTLPVNQRKTVTGALVAGNGGYNKNAAHAFKWHFDEQDWNLADVTIEIYDGKPYTDIDMHYDYWMGTVKRYGAWGSYIRRKLPVPID